MPSARTTSIMDVHIISFSLFGEMLAEESEDLAPAIHGLFGPVKRPVPIEEAVTGAVVRMEFVRLALLLELGLVHIHLLRARGTVIVAEQTEQRTVEVLCHVDRRNRCLVVEFFLAHHDPSAPKLHAGVDVLFLARIDEGVAAAGTGSEDAHLAVEVWLGAHPLYGSRRVADHLSIRNSALGAHLGGDVVGIALARALVEVCADRDVAMMGEPARRLDIELAPARKMMDKHHAGKRAGAGWL